MLKITDIYQINGEPRYRIKCDVNIENVEKIHSKLVDNDTEELFCYSTNVEGIYSFGAKQLTDGAFHGAGYVWSSRCGVINKEFNTQLVEANINGAGYWYIDVNVLKALVEEFTGNSYEIKKCEMFEDKEPYYTLVKKEG